MTRWKIVLPKHVHAGEPPPGAAAKYNPAETRYVWQYSDLVKPDLPGRRLKMPPARTHLKRGHEPYSWKGNNNA